MLSQIFTQSLSQFFANETQNIISGVSERNLCARFAMILERTAHNEGFNNYYADVEYNRKQNGEVKTILDDNMQIIVINSDLILHSRGEIPSRDNLITIEMKKSNRPESEKISDRTRLRTMTKSSYDDIWSADGETHPEHVCGYEIGYFIELDYVNRLYTIQKFRHGQQVDEYLDTF